MEKKYITLDKLDELISRKNISLTECYKKEILESLHVLQPLLEPNKRRLNDCTNSITKVLSLIQLTDCKKERYIPNLGVFLSNYYEKEFINASVQTFSDYILQQKHPDRVLEFSNQKRNTFININKVIVEKIHNAKTKKEVEGYVSLIYRMMNHTYDYKTKTITGALLEQTKIYT